MGTKENLAGQVIKNAAGTVQTKAGIAKTDYTEPDPKYVITNDTYAERPQPGSSTSVGRRLLWKAGQVVRKSDFDRAFGSVTLTSVAPTAGAGTLLVAGGTAITLLGTGFRGSTGATLGGNAVTSYVVVNDTTATAVAPAHAAGAVAATVTDDSGTSASLADAATYA